MDGTLGGKTPLFLLDVGASGGIDSRWFVFGDRLKAIGFDPLVTEVERLNRLNDQPGIRYEAAFVGARNYDSLIPRDLRSDPMAPRSHEPWARVSAIAVQKQLNESYVQRVYNTGAPVVLTDRHITLDDWIPQADYSSVDFIKIDTDGHEIEVLLGAEAILASGGVLGVSVEIQHHGAVHQHANTFDNIDRFLRGHGFMLFDLESYRYSRTAFPAPFVYDLAAQTESGQVMWSEGLYFRDLADPTYERKWCYIVSADRVLKLASLFEVFQLGDCAAELLLNRGDFLAPDVREHFLDLLAAGTPGSYRALIQEFQTDFEAFYPSRRKPAAPATPPAAIGGPGPSELNELRERVEEFRRKTNRLSERVQRQDEKIKRLSHRARELKAKIKGLRIRPPSTS